MLRGLVPGVYMDASVKVSVSSTTLALVCCLVVERYGYGFAYLPPVPCGAYEDDSAEYGDEYESECASYDFLAIHSMPPRVAVFGLLAAPAVAASVWARMR